MELYLAATGNFQWDSSILYIYSKNTSYYILFAIDLLTNSQYCLSFTTVTSLFIIVSQFGDLPVSCNYLK